MYMSEAWIVVALYFDTHLSSIAELNKNLEVYLT